MSSGAGDVLETYVTYLIAPNHVDPWVYGLILGIHLIVMLFFLFSMYEFLKQSRLISDTPTSKIRACAQGFVELKGIAKPLNEINAPLTKIPCAWWEFEIEKLRGSGKNSRWETIDKGTSDQAFVLSDETGECLVHPEGAEIIPHKKETWYGSSSDPLLSLNEKKRTLFSRQPYRFREHLILPQLPIYAIGMFRTLNPSKMAPDLGDIIRDWKSDYKALVEKYDINQDGELDEREWQQVLNDAEHTINAQRLDIEKETQGMSFHILSVEGLPKRRSFIISGLNENNLKANRKSSSKWCTFGFFVFFIHNLYAIGSKIL